MREPKFSLNALAGIVLVFTAVALFFSVRVTDVADRSVVNVFEKIPGTALSVRYSAYLPNGLYEGDALTGSLKVPGDFGRDWGCAAVGNVLYINEYRHSDLGVLFCDVVAVDLDGYEKTVAARGAVLRGRRGDGLLVFTETSPAGNLPEKNPLCALASLGTGVPPAAVTVILFDPETGAEVSRVRDDKAADEAHLSARYLTGEGGAA